VSASGFLGAAAVTDIDKYTKSPGRSQMVF